MNFIEKIVKEILFTIGLIVLLLLIDVALSFILYFALFSREAGQDALKNWLEFDYILSRIKFVTILSVAFTLLKIYAKFLRSK